MPLEGGVAERLTLVDTVDHLLNRGAVLSGHATLSLAGVDLVYVGLNLLVASVETLRSRDDSVPPETSRAQAALPPGAPQGPGPAGPPEWETGFAPGAASRSQPTLVSSAVELSSRVQDLTPAPTAEERPERGLARLVLALVELLRQLMERQAIRRVEGGGLTDEEVERVGLALRDLESKMAGLRSVFGLEESDTVIDLGPLGRLV